MGKEAGAATPKKSESRKKTKTIVTRVTPAEHAKIKAAAEKLGLTASAFMRIQALENDTADFHLAPTLDHAKLAPVLVQLAKVGNNLNQIAKQIHTGVPVNSKGVDTTLKHIIFLKDEILKTIWGKDGYSR